MDGSRLPLFQDRGPLFFPVTPFAEDGSVSLDVLRTHVSTGVNGGAGAVFAAGGTGEFHALSLDEFNQVVTTSVEATASTVPVFAGAGGSVAYATACAEIAKAAGATGLLLMPPYLVKSPQTGLLSYVQHVAAKTDLQIIVYNRDNAIFDPDTVVALAEIDNAVGFKDGHGDLELLEKIIERLQIAGHLPNQDFSFFNGLPTAEATMKSYYSIGITLYSSAAYAFVPEIATAFYSALRASDHDRCDALLSGFFEPLAELRSRVPGYAVALVKAGLRLRGVPVGPVRAPLVDVEGQDLDALSTLISTGLQLVSSEAGENRLVAPSP